MARYAKIEDGVCVNIIVADAEFAAAYGYIELAEGMGIGDSFDGTTWTKAPQPELPDVPDVPDVPVEASLEDRVDACEQDIEQIISGLEAMA
ncbi:MAG: hypothetical protein Q4B96_05260 [Bacillota bacterium]|nr:hypothetical protein [Bacillota bacterium]